MREQKAFVTYRGGDKKESSDFHRCDERGFSALKRDCEECRKTWCEGVVYICSKILTLNMFGSVFSRAHFLPNRKL